jgi:hypothetical protein
MFSYVSATTILYDDIDEIFVFFFISNKIVWQLEVLRYVFDKRSFTPASKFLLVSLYCLKILTTDVGSRYDLRLFNYFFRSSVAGVQNLTSTNSKNQLSQTSYKYSHFMPIINPFFFLHIYV